MNFEQQPSTTTVSTTNSPYGTLSVFDFRQMTLPPEKLAVELHCRQISATTAVGVQNAMEHTGIYDPSTVSERLASGRKGYVGEVTQGNDGQRQPMMVTFGWVSFQAEPMGSTGICFQPAPGDAWLFDFATLPEFRGRGYYPTLLRHILADLAQQNVRLAWIGTAPGNDTSAHSIARAGFQLVGYTALIFDDNGQPQNFKLLPAPNASEELLVAAQKTYVRLKY